MPFTSLQIWTVSTISCSLCPINLFRLQYTRSCNTLVCEALEAFQAVIFLAQSMQAELIY